MENNFESTFAYKLIYIFRINDKEHSSCLKIGDTTVHTNKNYKKLKPNCHELKYAARNRIDSYTSIAGIDYELLHTEIAVYECNDKADKKNGKILYFRDYDVHKVLLRSGIKKKRFMTGRIQNEWFECDVETAKKAITAVKHNQKALSNSDITYNINPIVFRPEQEEAVMKTVTRYRSHDKMLWNAKMRFGKTLCALEVAKRMKFKRTVIVTHRPVVSVGWYSDFKKIFYEKDNKYEFGSKTKGKTIEELLKNNSPFVYFASMQDLRGSDTVGGNFNKNDNIFKTLWDFVVVDEAHEGTQTELGKTVLQELIKNTKEHKTHILELSGTPFNLLSDFAVDEIYTWDYIMEQEAKNNWSVNHFGDSNPYEELPKLNIFTYHLEKALPVYTDVGDKAFNFREFFRIWTGDIDVDFKHIPENVMAGDFVHEDDINAFLDLLCKKDDDSNYPFATNEYRDFFRHSLWIVPGVKEAKALSKLLRKHRVFGNNEFKIVNVAGAGDEEIFAGDALKLLKQNIGDKPETTRTITLSCGRLTAGVTVPEWTAVFMLAGTYSTAASQYLQTIFRVQSPANINGKMKENCFVFDFAPDRTLKMVAESVQLSSRAGARNEKASVALRKFLNYCPVISVDGSSMHEFTVDQMLRELKKAYAERVVRNGFDDYRIYNDELLKLTDIELNDFKELKKIVGASKQTKKQTDININNEGFDDEKFEDTEKLKKKKKKDLTEEEKKRLADEKEQKKKRMAAISILRAISIRMPLIVYGADTDIDDSITIDKFTDLLDDLSWLEFMPKGVTKDIFKKFSKYYDKDIFIGAALRIRAISRTADELEPLERVKKIAALFKTFKNPDKETVLTPWRVVNMHLSNMIGGYDFFDNNHENEIAVPRFVNIPNITDEIFDTESKILEINSKSGLYPLYMTYSLYRKKCKSIPELEFDDKVKIWDETIKNNIYVICKAKMSKSIVRRTLLGYRKGKINSHTFEDLLMQFIDKPNELVKRINQKVFWNIKENSTMDFKVIIGNPPYQDILSDNKMSKNVYHEFVKTSIKLKPDYISLIMPAKWSAGEMGPYKEMKGFYEFFTSGNHLIKMYDYTSSRMIFDNVDIKGGICYFLYSKNYSGKLNYNLFESDNKFNDMRIISEASNNIMVRYPQLILIIEKVKLINDKTFNEIVSSWNPYGFISDFFINNHNINISESSKNSDDILIYGLYNMKRTYRYIAKKDLIKNSGGLYKYKVFLTRANGSGQFGEKFSNPIIGKPNEICTDTFLEVGKFDTKDEAANCAKFIKTRFFRALVGAKKTGVFNYKDAFQYVTLEDFSNNSDINWNAKVDEIDNQLFLKYHLNENLISFIMNKIQKME